MSFTSKLQESISDLHLLDHPFYKDWVEGRLSVDTLQEYANQYYVHVNAVPRYISATHSRCDDISKRRVLLENLADEEGLHGEHHPELWLRFAEGVGLDRATVEKSEGKPPVRKVVNSFLSWANSSYSEGLASLYSYEYQIPEIAKTKIDGLVRHYGIQDQPSLAFFKVHQEADVFHREACEKLLNELDPEQQKAARIAARSSAKALWDFLSSFKRESCAA